eukprot:1161360-Pelagomonas_calceolata.AAC.9
MRWWWWRSWCCAHDAKCSGDGGDCVMVAIVVMVCAHNVACGDGCDGGAHMMLNAVMVAHTQKLSAVMAVVVERT